MPAPSPAPSPAASSPPVARLRTPGELLAVVPLLCGFVPSESLVLLCLRGPGRRVVLTARVDLPAGPAHDALAGDLADRVVAAGASQVVLAVWTDEPGDRPRSALVQSVTERLASAGVPVLDALLVRRGRWLGYDCTDAGCCPPGGSPLPDRSPAVDLVAAAGALEGRAVLPSRAALAATVQAPVDLAGAARRQAGAEDARCRRLAEQGRVRTGRASLRRWLEALRTPPDDDGAAALAVSLRDLLVRDEVLTWLLDDADALLVLLLDLARRTAPPHDAAVCAVLAWTAHARGDGALADLALDRALGTDPRCSLAVLARQALDRAVPPGELRAVLVDTRRVLRADHPWTGRP